MKLVKAVASIKVQSPLLPRSVMVEIMDVEILVDMEIAEDSVANSIIANLNTGSSLTWHLDSVRNVTSVPVYVAGATPIIEGAQQQVPREALNGR
jgi:hypothetical protein